MSGYDKLPRQASIEVSPFRLATSSDELQSFRHLIRLSKLGPRTYENSSTDGKYGLSYEWMTEAKAYWENTFDW